MAALGLQASCLVHMAQCCPSPRSPVALLPHLACSALPAPDLTNIFDCARAALHRAATRPTLCKLTCSQAVSAVLSRSLGMPGDATPVQADTRGGRPAGRRWASGRPSRSSQGGGSCRQPSQAWTSRHSRCTARHHRSSRAVGSSSSSGAAPWRTAGRTSAPWMMTPTAGR